MDTVAGILTLLIIWIVLMLVCRELVCWYWKINRIVAALEKLAANSEQLEPRLRSIVHE